MYWRILVHLNIAFMFIGYFSAIVYIAYIRYVCVFLNNSVCECNFHRYLLLSLIKSQSLFTVRAISSFNKIHTHQNQIKCPRIFNRYVCIRLIWDIYSTILIKDMYRKDHSHTCWSACPLVLFQTEERKFIKNQSAILSMHAGQTNQILKVLFSINCF